MFGKLFFQFGISFLFIAFLGSNSFAVQSTNIVVKSLPDPLPFWKKKPKVLAEMKEERRIVVSAKTDRIDEESELYQMKVVSAGYVNSPLERTWSIVRKYEDLPKADERFLEVRHDPEKQTLYLHVATLGYHARMTLQLNYGEAPEAKEIHFDCIEGSFKGMKGVIRLEDDRRQQTEISMTSDYRSSNLPLPKVLMGVGLEIVASRVASSMRNFIETAKGAIKQ
jgi:uncharacterized membrane protein